MKILTGSFEELENQVTKREQQAASRPEVESAVQDIIANVRTRGDEALKEYSAKFDKTQVDEFRVSDETIEAGYNACSEELLDALRLAKKNITSYHEQEVSRGFIDAKQLGVIRGQKLTPLAAVGLYVPGGTAAYPSTIMMAAIPAKIAGVKNIVMVTPPQPEGINPAVLAAAKLAGVDAVYQIGGAQAIAALAFGTESIPRVDKIMGPGNIFVATAKKQVFGQVAIDMIAGPSEIGVIADEKANARQLAADLLSQAEHDKLARPMLVTPSLEVAKAVSAEIERQLKTLPREEIARASVENEGFIAITKDLDQAFDLMNLIAPEHLEVQVDEPITYLNRIQNAGSVFLGRTASEPLGDYVAGPNHILPTAGTARFFSPLGVEDFVKRIQFVQYTQPALAKEASAITILARTEGLEAHARAIESRFEDDAK
ncbi:histidinol dehydrogenase [Lacticaseibacillus porcinae]|uniref:histidinol dehydrogenase n=1 Tax=Lacticaseibacillus porcinae TaxID=1123687 RepID=UPI000F7A4A7F|nr:histidinol dehydrogenase [Lacticaseibacillus porcinae]